MIQRFRRIAQVLLVALLLFGVTLVPASKGVPSGVGVAQAAETWTAQQEQYLRTTLAVKIGGTCTNSYGRTFTALPDYIMLKCSRYASTGVSVVNFLVMFSDAIPDAAPPSTLPAPIYDALTAIEAASWANPDGGYGYQEFFDQWKAEGLIN